jgi:WXG100 family type VII secretion target
MASQITSVDIQGMVAAQANFQCAVDQVNTAYCDMLEQQATLMENWKGEAASTFGIAFERYLEDFKTVRSELEGILEALHENTGVYANTEGGSRQVAASFASHSGLPGLPGLDG